MSDRAYAKVQVQQKTLIGSSSKSSLLQRTCACGQHTIAGAECSTCRSEQSTLHRSQRAFEPPSALGAVPGSSPAQENGTSFNSAFDRALRFGHNFCRIPIHPPAAGAIQTKLAINKPGDEYEQEADRISEHVMHMPEPSPIAAASAVSWYKGVERQDEEKKPIQTKRAPTANAEAALDAEAAVGASARVGAPLPGGVRSYFEPRFGYDFSHVRVHADGEAAEGARAVRARAYTIGHNIVFGSGQYAPAAVEGKRLLAHELVHVVQQAAVQPQGPENAIEKSGLTPIAHSGSVAYVQRFTEPGHKMIGDEAFHEAWSGELLTLGPGLQVTFGDAVAMGDYFGSFENMKRLAEKPGKGPGTQGEVRYVLWVKIREQPVEHRLGIWYDKDAVRVRDQAERRLTGSNISHFPNPSAGDTALDPLQKNQRVDQNMPFGALATYRQGHEKAMDMAYAHGANREPMEDALLADAFACHFLTDSFSASHARVPRASIKEYWDKLVPGFHHKLIQWLADQVEHAYGRGERAAAIGIPFIPVVGPIVGSALHLPNATVRTATVEKLSIALSPTDSYSFGNVVSLIVHDVEGARGVDASIGGTPITLVGDKDLVTDDIDPITEQHTHKLKDGAQPTFDAAVRAVKASIEDLWTAYNAGWHSEGFSEKGSRHFEKAMGRDRLYTAERLVPQPLDDSRVPAEKRSLFWMHKSIGDFLADKNIQKGLVKWGEIEAPEFEKKLNEMKDRGELPAQARDAMQRVLIDPLKSGNPENIRQVILAIIAHS